MFNMNGRFLSSSPSFPPSIILFFIDEIRSIPINNMAFQLLLQHSHIFRMKSLYLCSRSQPKESRNTKILYKCTNKHSKNTKHIQELKSRFLLRQKNTLHKEHCIAQEQNYIELNQTRITVSCCDDCGKIYNQLLLTHLRWRRRHLIIHVRRIALILVILLWVGATCLAIRARILLLIILGIIVLVRRVIVLRITLWVSLVVLIRLILWIGLILDRISLNRLFFGYGGIVFIQHIISS